MMRCLVVAVVCAAFASACNGDEGTKLSVQELQDPETCKQCHPVHYQQWSGSMHAYSSEDPVFVAMNARGQRDTNGALGDLCVNCHAPMAVLLGEATGASFDPDALSSRAKGVTCYFCHNVESIEADHNNGLVLAMDQTMRGGVRDPSNSPAHNSMFDPENMAGKTNNSRLCGACHDVVLPNGVHLERTFGEWKETVFATTPDDPTLQLPQTCSGCHMFPSDGLIAEGEGLDVRPRDYGFHEHAFPGVDLALTPFPEMDEQARLVQRDLDASLQIVGLKPSSNPREAMGGICVQPGGQIFTVRIDTLNVGHMFPSGASQDRRAWIEVKAFDANNQIVFESGVVPDGVDPETITNDRYLRCEGPEACSGFWDRTFKTDGSPAHFFWDVASINSKLLKPAITFNKFDPLYDHSTTVRYEVGPSLATVERIEAKLKLRALPYALLDDLIASGDLDPAIRDRLPTLEPAAAQSTWLRSTAGTGLAVNTGCNPF